MELSERDPNVRALMARAWEEGADSMEHTSIEIIKHYPPYDIGSKYQIEFDGFVGTVIGGYTRLDGERGVVMQQDGTNIVHVYRRKWLKAVDESNNPFV